MLNDKGRIRLSNDLTGWVQRATAPMHVTHEIALAAQQLALARQDPADRFLAATALILDLTLVTADMDLLGLGEIATLANR